MRPPPAFWKPAAAFEGHFRIKRRAGDADLRIGLGGAAFGGGNIRAALEQIPRVPPRGSAAAAAKPGSEREYRTRGRHAGQGGDFILINATLRDNIGRLRAGAVILGLRLAQIEAGRRCRHYAAIGSGAGRWHRPAVVAANNCSCASRPRRLK